MRKKGGIYILIAIVTLAALFLLQYNEPKNINWFPSYVASHKIPYGTLVFNTLLKDTFAERIEDVYIPPFEHFIKDQEAQGTYLFVNDRVAFEKAELDQLLNWTAQGNKVFIASRSFEQMLLDTLNLDTGVLYDTNFKEIQRQSHQWANPSLKVADSVVFDREPYAPYFNSLDTLKTTVLGSVRFLSDQTNAKDSISYNIVKQPFGKGILILSAFPEAFTNYFILKGKNKDYTSGIFAYLDHPGKLYVDHYYKSGKSFYTSPMYIFLNTKELKWAYYLVLIGVLVYIVFEGKRKQRAIPVVTPLQNQTMAFTRTIADMYFEKGDAKNIAEHKINYFLEELRNTYYMGNYRQDDAFYKNLAARSGHSVDWITSFFGFMDQLKNGQHVTDQQLIKLNTLIDKFKAGSYGSQ